jgi:Gamma-glutamyltransferase
MATGVMGAFMQAQGHVQMVINTQCDGMDVQTAIDHPRWRFIEGKKIELEAGFDQLMVHELIRLGHDIQVMAPGQNGGFGGAQLIATLPNQDGYVGGSDPRKDGQVMMIG